MKLIGKIFKNYEELSNWSMKNTEAIILSHAFDNSSIGQVIISAYMPN
jgi:hypothetical protein